MAIRIVVAEHDPVQSERLCETIKSIPDHDVVGMARNGWEAVAAVGQHIPDLLLLRMELPGFDGLEVLRVVQWYSPATKVIMFSLQNEESVVLDVLRLGARGYIVEWDEAILRKAILVVERGEVWAQRRVVATIINELIRLAHLTFANTADVEWSKQIG